MRPAARNAVGRMSASRWKRNELDIHNRRGRRSHCAAIRSHAACGCARGLECRMQSRFARRD